MFVVNFDFSQHILPIQLLAINLPILLTEIITYPLQRLQTLLVAQPTMTTNKQIYQISYLIRNMISIQGFPKLLHGMRYSVDYMGTQMTTKFFIFQILNGFNADPQRAVIKWKLFVSCFIANLVSTAASQIAFNYQTIASSLPIHKNNRGEDVKIKLEKYTKLNKFPVYGLKYSLPASVINTTAELFIMKFVNQNIGKLNITSYLLGDFITAFGVFSTTAFVLHYVFQRQVQICKQLPQKSIPYSRGLLGSILRYNLKGMTLFGLYTLYFETKTRKQIGSIFQRRNSNQPMSYRLARN